jgi:hypothetical protein
MFIATAPGAGATVAPGHARAHAAPTRAEALAALRGIRIAPPASHARPSPASRSAHTLPDKSVQVKNTSDTITGNWSGYADNNSGGQSYTQVSASWVQPAVTCTSDTLSIAAFWVGLDGLANGTVEQAGSEAECYEGSAFYTTFYEMYPTGATQLSTSNGIVPGDTVTASVTRSGTSYALSFSDPAHPASDLSATQTCTDCGNTSAEWIAEAPSSTSGTIFPLADYGTWTVTSASVATTAASGVITSFPVTEVQLYLDDAVLMSNPQGLNSSGNGFSTMTGAITYDCGGGLYDVDDGELMTSAGCTGPYGTGVYFAINFSGSVVEFDDDLNVVGSLSAPTLLCDTASDSSGDVTGGCPLVKSS